MANAKGLGGLDALRPIAPSSMVSDRVYQQLSQAIRDGDLPPGTRLVERVLAERLGVSRTPVREALKELVKDGLASPDRQRGLVVARLSLDTIAAAYQVRAVLEGMAARLAAARPDPAHIQELAEAVEGMARCGNANPAAYDQYHEQFHDRIAVMSQNSYVVQYLSDLSVFRTRMVSVGWVPPTRTERAMTEHRGIYEAIAAGDGDRAAELSEAHVRRTGAALLQRLAGEAADEQNR